MKIAALASLLAVASAQQFNTFDEYRPVVGASINALELQTLPVMDVQEEMRKAYEQEASMEKVLIVGKINEASDDLMSVAQKTRVAQGTLFSTAYSVENAKALAVHFDQFVIPEGGAVYLIGSEEVYGPFTHETKWQDGNFMTDHIKGDTVRIEYYHGDSAAEQPIIHIDTVTSVFREPSAMMAGTCNIQAICASSDFRGQCSGCRPTDRSCSIQCTHNGGVSSNAQFADNSWWTNQMAANVAVASSSGSRFCSGAFVNNVAGKPMVLTAAHCSVGNTARVQHMFHSDRCNDSSDNSGTVETFGNLNRVANSAESDITLLEINSITSTNKPRQPLYMSGWDARYLASTGVVGIHHPSGANMKVSHSSQTVTDDRWSGSGPPSHWRVNAWSEATTEGGSSGSPLYSEVTGRIIGQLHGGSASCPANNGWDTYGAIYRSMEVSAVSNALRNGDSSVTFMDGRFY